MAKYKTDIVGRVRKVRINKWGYEIEKDFRPLNWPWPFAQIGAFFKFREFLPLCDPEEIGYMRQLVDYYGLPKGITIFETWIIARRSTESYHSGRALEDIANGNEPGHADREYDRRIAYEKEKEYKRQLLNEYKKNMKDAELDNVSVEDLLNAINNQKKRP